ncbi:MAG: integrase arm-type DNA-binding domain-containing protein, partial [Smithella sp.]
MPKRIIPLTDLKVQKVKPQDKPISLFDGGGLYLLVTPSGGKLWRFKYRFAGKEKKIAFGSYPEISLICARQRRDDARRLLANNVDPGAVRKAQKQAKIEDIETFEVIAREWFNKFKPTWEESHSSRVLSRLEKNVFPYIGERPIVQVKAPELLGVLRRLEARGILHSAHNIRGICGQIFRYAVATGRAERDPSADLR